MSDQSDAGIRRSLSVIVFLLAVEIIARGVWVVSATVYARKTTQSDLPIKFLARFFSSHAFDGLTPHVLTQAKPGLLAGSYTAGIAVAAAGTYTLSRFRGVRP